ncbi:MAG: hypothetical protein K1Y02_11810 [Candidatus Hydrogenedentes bacterium]|nr:hypothetical protein [Candidatus Hydrogenedentota bacterium]
MNQRLYKSLAVPCIGGIRSLKGNGPLCISSCLFQMAIVLWAATIPASAQIQKYLTVDSGDSLVRGYDESISLQTSFSTGSISEADVCASDAYLYVLDNTAKKVVRYSYDGSSPASSKILRSSTGVALGIVAGVAVDEAANELWVADKGNGGRLHVYNLTNAMTSGGATSLNASRSISSPTGNDGLALDADYAYVLEKAGNRKVYRYQRSNGQSMGVSKQLRNSSGSNLDSVVGGAIEDGFLWVVNGGPLNTLNKFSLTDSSNGLFPDGIAPSGNPKQNALYTAFLPSTNTSSVGLAINPTPAAPSISLAGATPTNATSLVFTVTFGEAVTGLDAADFVPIISGSFSTQPAIGSVTGSGKVWTVTISSGTGVGTVGLKFVDNDSVKDVGKLPVGGTNGNASDRVGPSYDVDTTVPSVAVTQAAGQADPTDTTPIHFTATFSESVTGFDASDVTLGGTAGGTRSVLVTGGPATYDISIDTIGTDGTVTVSISAGRCTDLLGVNANTASLSTDNSIRVDRNAPSVSTVLVTSANQVDVTFSEELASGATTAANYSISGTGRGSLALHPDSVTSLGGNTYRLSWLSGEMVNGGNVTITVSNVQDLAGYAIAVAGQSGTHTGGGIGTPPTITGVSVYNGFNIDIVFSESMGSGTTSGSNYTLSGSGKGTLSANPSAVTSLGNGRYRLGWPSGEMLNGGDITITATGVQDAAGNTISPLGNASTVVGGGIGVAPTVASVNVVDGTHINVVFSEAMGVGVTTAANYAISGQKGTLPSAPASVSQVSSGVYQLAWTSGELKSGGVFTVTVQNVKDAAGNILGSPNTATGTGVGTAPALSEVKVVNALQVDVTFNEPMGSGVTSSSNYAISGAKGTLSSTPATVALVSGNTYRLTWTSGEMVSGGDVTITATNVADTAGNTIGASNSATHVKGGIGTLPTVTSIHVIDATNVSVTFSESMGSSALVANNYSISGDKGTLSLCPNLVTFTSGSTYRLEWSSGEMKDGGTITITSSDAADLAGNAIGSTGNSATEQGTGVGVKPSVSAVSAVDSTHVDVTFSEAIGTGAATASNFTLSGSGKGTLNATPTAVVALDESTYRLAWSSGEMKSGGDVTVSVANVQDLAGNGIGAANSATQTGGGIGQSPTVTVNTLTTSGRTPRLTGTVADNVAVTGVNVTVNGNTYAAVVTGTTWYVLVSDALPFVTQTYDVEAKAVDTAGNVGEDSTTNELTIDVSKPTIVEGIVRVGATPSNAATVEFQVIFSANVTGVDESDFTLRSGSIGDASVSGVTGSGTTYTVSVNSGTGDGTIGLDLVDDNSILDESSNSLGGAALNDGDYTNGPQYEIDKTAPSIALAETGESDGLFIDVTFSEAVTTAAVSASNYALSGSGKGSLTDQPDSAVLDHDHVYRLRWNAGEMTKGGDVTVSVSNVQDRAGNTVNPLGGQFTITGGGIGVLPTVIDVSVVDALHVSVSFSESLRTDALTPGNYTLSGSGQGSLSDTPESVTDQGDNTYLLAWTSGEMRSNGDVTITAQEVHDIAGNVVDPSANSDSDLGGGMGEDPVVTVNTLTTAKRQPVLSGTVSDNTGVTSVEVQVNGNTYPATVGGGAWTAEVTDALPFGVHTYDVQAVATDVAGNTATDSTSNELTVNTGTPVQVTAITLQNTNPSNAASVGFKVEFASPVTGVDSADFTLHDGSISDAAVTSISGSGNTYTVAVSTGTGSGSVGIDLVDDGTILDSNLNPLGGPEDHDGDYTSGPVYTIDKTAPTVVLTSGSAVVNTPLIPVTATFNESVTGFAQDDIAAGPSAVGKFKAVSDKVYTFDITPSQQGDVTISVKADAARDKSGNGSTASSALKVTYDMLPAVVVSSPSVRTTQNGPVTYTLTFVDAVEVNLTLNDVRLIKSGTANGEVSISEAKSATTRTVTVSNITGTGTLGIEIAAGVCKDASGNLSPKVYDSGSAFTVELDVPESVPVSPWSVAVVLLIAGMVAVYRSKEPKSAQVCCHNERESNTRSNHLG